MSKRKVRRFVPSSVVDAVLPTLALPGGGGGGVGPDPIDPANPSGKEEVSVFGANGQHNDGWYDVSYTTV